MASVSQSTEHTSRILEDMSEQVKFKSVEREGGEGGRMVGMVWMTGERREDCEEDVRMVGMAGERREDCGDWGGHHNENGEKGEDGYTV